MREVTQALYNVLANDLTLVTLIAKYQGDPAIFTFHPVPEDAVLPFIVTEGEISLEPDDTKTTTRLDVMRVIDCYVEGRGDSGEIEAISDRVRVLLHDTDMPVVGWSTSNQSVSGPEVAPTDPSIYGRRLTLFLTLEKEK